jgi:hypothetical protein
MNYRAIEDDLESTAFSMFRDWTGSAQQSYPDLSFVIKEEAVLVSDLKEVIVSALSNLNKNDDRLFRSIFMPGWDIGYVYGFIEGKLNQLWLHEYIVKQSEEYRHIMVLSALQSYLQSDDPVQAAILHRYRQLLHEDVNLAECNDTFQEFTIDYKKLSISTTGNDVDDCHLITTSIEKLRVSMIFACTRRDTPNFLPSVDRYFTTEQIRRLIADNSTTT